MDGQQIGMIAGWIGGILGIVLGFGGGLIGVYVPYRLATSPRQKAYILRSAAFVLGLVMALMVGLTLVPAPWNLLVWIPYIVMLLVSIGWMNKGQKRIAEEEAAAAKQQPSRGTP